MYVVPASLACVYGKGEGAWRRGGGGAGAGRVDCTIIYGKFYYKNSHFSGWSGGELIMVEDGWG